MLLGDLARMPPVRVTDVVATSFALPVSRGIVANGGNERANRKNKNKDMR